MSTPRLLSAAKANVSPAYPVARLVKGAVFEAERVRDEAKTLLAEARAEAERIRAEAIADADATRAAGVEQARREFAATTAGLLTSLESQVARQRQAFAMEVQRVALRIARAVVDVEFSLRPEHVIRVVEEVLAQASLRRELRIHAHPSALAHLQANRDALLELAPSARTMEFKADPDLLPHDVRIETEWGNYESALNERFAQLERGLVEAAGGTKGDA